MNSWKKFFPARFVRAVDLEGHGDVTVTIQRVVVEEVKVPPKFEEVEQCLIAYFEGTERGLMLKPVLCETIAALYGDDIDGWPGKRITLYVERGVRAFGERWDVIRIRPAWPSTGKKTPVIDDPVDEETDQLDACSSDMDDLEIVLAEIVEALDSPLFSDDERREVCDAIADMSLSEATAKLSEVRDMISERGR